ncbi:ras/Rap GTPase-activating protein SynGAP [Clarias gariepinus]|uniref:ras/Rap GTPase-activating protein SynGAP n=1 Tax=Clarias gariepinus TaxID=13013 RepID=UPI00234DA97C|nr:ras/Rap GTPase-activating protein SynGAP [Clarias gariepinus]
MDRQGSMSSESLADIRGFQEHSFSSGHPRFGQHFWNPKFCVVTDGQMVLLDKDQVDPFILQQTMADTCKLRLLRRTISVPVESQFPAFHNHTATETVENQNTTLKRVRVMLECEIISHGGELTAPGYSLVWHIMLEKKAASVWGMFGYKL